MSRRLHYIDWLRVLAVLLLFPYHTLRVFNAGDPFYVKGPHMSQAITVVLSFIDFWHMPLLFLLAGASTYFALSKRSGWQYLGERFKRLLVPLLFGWLLLIPPQTWYGARFNSAYTGTFVHYITSGDFLVWNVQGGGDYYGGFGLGHLWFILYLFLIAIIVLPLLLLWRRPKSRTAGGISRFLAKPAGWPLVGVLLMVFEGLPSPIEDKSFFYFGALFVLGYLVMSDDAFMDSAVRYRWTALGTGVTLIVIRMAFWRAHDSLADPSWQLALFNSLVLLGVWLIIVGLLGLGQRHLDTPSRPLSYLAEGSYAIYILHQTVIVVLAYYFVRLQAPWFVQWLALLIAVVLVSFALYEVIRLVNPLRFLFGMKPRARGEA